MGIREKAEHFAEQHRKAFETWEHGGIKDAWRDQDGNICIAYEDGRWWRYREKAGGVIEWW